MTLGLLRCDATLEGGVGHLVRALAVARAAVDAGWQVELCGDVQSPLGRSLVAELGIEVVPVDTADLGVLAAARGAAVVHLDDYGVAAGAREEVARADVVLSSMEDGAFGRRPADIVIDSTIGAEDEARPDDGSPVVLRGIGYAPMRPEVLRARERRAARAGTAGSSAAHVLVVMGGTDAVGAAAVVAGVCARASRIGRLTVVAPPERWGAIRDAVGDRPVRTLEPFPGLLDMAAEDVDVVVSAAGTTAWELACIGVPTALVPVVENQRAGYEAAVRRGVAEGLGALEDVRSHPELAAARLDAIIASAGDRDHRPQVDGLGAHRVVAAWSAMLGSRASGAGDRPVTARRATPEDSLVLLRWRNDRDVRAVSRSSGLTGWAEHQRWFARALESPDQVLLVAESAGRRVGTARFDRRSPKEWEVSITLAPEQRGRGLAGKVLAAAETAFSEHLDESANLAAAILPANVASRRLFERAGYDRSDGRTDGAFDVLVKRVERATL